MSSLDLRRGTAISQAIIDGVKAARMDGSTKTLVWAHPDGDVEVVIRPRPREEKSVIPWCEAVIIDEVSK